MANIRKAPPPSLTDSEQAFLMKEFELLRTWVDDAIGELRNLDRWVLVTTAAVWTWILTNYPTILRSAAPGSSAETAPAPSSPPWLLVGVPVFIVLVFFVKTFAINQTLDVANEYLRDHVEARIGPGKYGFETCFFDKRGKKETKTGTRVRMALVRRWSYVYYGGLAIVYIAVAIWAKHPSQ